jgi:hypothetical protein
MVSIASEDLPLPLTPTINVILLWAIETSMPFKLFVSTQK